MLLKAEDLSSDPHTRVRAKADGICLEPWILGATRGEAETGAFPGLVGR